MPETITLAYGRQHKGSCHDDTKLTSTSTALKIVRNGSGHHLLNILEVWTIPYKNYLKDLLRLHSQVITRPRNLKLIV